MWHKDMPTYREGDAVYIYFKTGNSDMVGKGGDGDIGVQIGLANGVAKVLLHKLSEVLKQKRVKYCSIHLNIKLCRTHKHTDIFLYPWNLKTSNTNSISPYLKSNQVNN